MLLTQLCDALGTALGRIEQAHAKCDLKDPSVCDAEQYGDGQGSDHEFILETRTLLDRANQAEHALAASLLDVAHHLKQATIFAEEARAELRTEVAPDA